MKRLRGRREPTGLHLCVAQVWPRKGITVSSYRNMERKGKGGVRGRERERVADIESEEIGSEKLRGVEQIGS